MPKELEDRLVSFVNLVAKGCDVCPHRNSSYCVGCYGGQAKTLVRDINATPWNDEHDERELSILAKLSEATYTPCVTVALDCGMTMGIFKRAASRLAEMGIVEVKERWIKKIPAR